MFTFSISKFDSSGDRATVQVGNPEFVSGHIKT
jgi:hypothetical protein